MLTPNRIPDIVHSVVFWVNDADIGYTLNKDTHNHNCKLNYLKIYLQQNGIYCTH